MPRSATDAHPSTHGRAFGLDLEVAFPCPGLAPATPARNPAVRLELTTQRALAAQWPRRAERVRRYALPGQRPYMTLDRDEADGYLYRFKDLGWFRVSADATLVQCAPGRVAAGRWQRFLVGQVLPFVSVLRGLEPFHASAASHEGGAIAFFGGSHAGKSTFALGLVLRGARLLTDDVLIATIGDDGAAYAHPAFGLMNIRHPTAERLTRQVVGALGATVYEDEEEIRVEVDVAREPVRLKAMCFITRSEAAGEPVIERIDPADPRRLIGATFNAVINTPERWTRQLDLCAALTRAVPSYLVRRPMTSSSQDLVDDVLAGIE